MILHSVAATGLFQVQEIFYSDFSFPRIIFQALLLLNKSEAKRS